jgi:hypothetical protein
VANCRDARTRTRYAAAAASGAARREEGAGGALRRCRPSGSRAAAAGGGVRAPAFVRPRTAYGYGAEQIHAAQPTSGYRVSVMSLTQRSTGRPVRAAGSRGPSERISKEKLSPGSRVAVSAFAEGCTRSGKMVSARRMVSAVTVTSVDSPAEVTSAANDAAGHGMSLSEVKNHQAR